MTTIRELVDEYNEADKERMRLAGDLYDALCAAPGHAHVHFGGGSQPDAWSGVWQHDSQYARLLMRDRLLNGLAKPIASVDNVDVEGDV